MVSLAASSYRNIPSICLWNAASIADVCNAAERLIGRRVWDVALFQSVEPFVCALGFGCTQRGGRSRRRCCASYE